MKIAIASSGLGHVARGIETWAEDLARALAERVVDHAAGVASVTLFTGAELPLRDEAWNLKLESGEKHGSSPVSGLRIVVIPCLKRSGRLVNFLTRVAPGFLWRWSLKSPYGWEQLSFWLHLWPILRKERFDILHVQDPMLAFWCRRFRQMGLLKTREILAHGTEEPANFLGQFDYVQHLAPWHLEQAMRELVAKSGKDSQAQTGKRNAQRSTLNIQRSSEEAGAGSSFRTQKSGTHSSYTPTNPHTHTHSSWRAIPNFVDTNVFRPVKDSDEKTAIRERMGIPTDAFVVGTVAAVKRTHKRIDYLIREFADVGDILSAAGGELEVEQSRNGKPGSSPVSRYSIVPSFHHSRTPFLLIAGARTDESEELIQMANELVPGRVKIMLDLPRADMPDVYRAMDVFVMTSLFEMMPIALLEAMASGLPVIINRHPVLEWIAGAAGGCVVMAQAGALAGEIRQCNHAGPAAQRGNAARQRAADMFSTNAVVEQIIGMYENAILKAENVRRG